MALIWIWVASTRPYPISHTVNDLLSSMISMSNLKGCFDLSESAPLDLFQTWAWRRGCLGQGKKRYEQWKLADLPLWYSSCARSWCRIRTPPPSSSSLQFRWPQECYFQWVFLKNIMICKFSFLDVRVRWVFPFISFYSIGLGTTHTVTWVHLLLQWSSRLRNSKNQNKYSSNAWRNSLILNVGLSGIVSSRPRLRGNYKFPELGITLRVFSAKMFRVWAYCLRKWWFWVVLWLNFRVYQQTRWWRVGSIDHWWWV